ncbi:CvpA family protein [Helicobacter pullorum]|uniref:CvpA family protein n=1 Tax=Helicobacter pullorum TaxID=35818 RepID=UPI0006CDE345|nr:CvpA family protein [Helicobacter pullorum]KPH53787.1 colicin V synthesis protein [Helicobacter pullorum]
MDGLSYFDLIIGALILLIGIKGIVNGFIREVFGLFGIVGGVYIASVYSTQAGEWISQNIYTFENPSAIALIGFLVLLIVVWVASLVVAEILQRAVNMSSQSTMNRMLGFCFGALKTFMIFAVIFYAVSNIQIAKGFMQKHTQNSVLYPLLLDAGEVIIKLDVPQEEVKQEAIPQEKIQETAEDIENKVDNSLR